MTLYCIAVALQFLKKLLMRLRIMVPRLKRAFHQGLLRMRDALPFHTHRWLRVVTLEPLDLLLAAFEAWNEPITILQIGACDGITNDPIYHFVRRGRARAILVEPNPYAFARLQNAYAGLPNVTLIQAAVGEKDGEADLYRLKKIGKAESEVDLKLQNWLLRTGALEANP
jgi:hypothetical protein